ncbi:MAG: cadherin-like beta sandwich domain-containing protein, partial [Spirochaetaceae bacterium]|nr:cadherin-like beta sandwich domain-containing protein [Spirochaetaceae bacterium]
YIDSEGKSLDTKFDAWVVGLKALTVSGPGLSVPALNLGDFSYTPATHTGAHTYDLGVVPNTVNTLDITATSAIADTEGGASFTITPVPDDGNADSGETETISLAEGRNTITITVSLDKRDGNPLSNPSSNNIEKRTYTLTICRTPEVYVSSPGSTPPGNDSTGDGSQNKPYATIQKALEKAKTFDLGGIPGAEVIIIISGTVTAVSGAVTNDSMVDISGSGYPHIILKVADTGTNAINASLTKRVLYIGGGNTVSLEDNLTLTGGSASNNGGGVLVAGGTFVMTGGVIQNNIATYFGGGVYVSSGTFTMTGGTIEGNDTLYGGGIFASSTTGVTIIKTGGTIAGSPAVSPLLPNTASSGGHAVYLTGISSKKRDATAGTDVNLYAKYDGSVWNCVDPLPIADGGAGDTTGAWD